MAVEIQKFLRGGVNADNLINFTCFYFKSSQFHVFCLDFSPFHMFCNDYC